MNDTLKCFYSSKSSKPSKHHAALSEESDSDSDSDSDDETKSKHRVISFFFHFQQLIISIKK